jgi:hypothetical protein
LRYYTLAGAAGTYGLMVSPWELAGRQPWELAALEHWIIETAEARRRAYGKSS